MPPLEGLGEDVLTIPHDAERLQTVYFDTPDFRLARWGVSLRHREGQGWTTKLPPEKDGGALLVRGEFTFPGEDTTTPPDEAIDRSARTSGRPPSGPWCGLRTIRRLIQLLDLDDRLLAEVVDDEVSVLSGRRIAARFRELEVEITDDTPDGLLDEVLERLRAAGAGAPDPTPKYERAVGPFATLPPEVRGGGAHLGVDREPGPEQDARHVGQPPPSARRGDPIGRGPRRRPSGARGHPPAALGPPDVPRDARSRLVGAASGGAALARDGPRRGAGRRRAACALAGTGRDDPCDRGARRRPGDRGAPATTQGGPHRAGRFDLRRALRRAPRPVRRGRPVPGRAPGSGRAREGSRPRPLGRAVASPARSREGGGQAPGRRGAAHGPDQGQAGAVCGGGGCSHRRQTRSEVRRVGGGAPGDLG